MTNSTSSPTHRFGVASTQASTAPLILAQDHGTREISPAPSSATAAAVEKSSTPISYMDRARTFDDDEDSAADSEPEQEISCEDSARVRQKANWPLYRRYPLEEFVRGWGEAEARAIISKEVDSPFAHLRKKHCDLHRVPAEIRNRIYELVLVSGKPIKATEHPRDAIPSLLQVCRQVRSEALPIFYSQNTFLHVVKNVNTAHLCLWLNSIGRQSCRHLTSLAVCCEGIIRSFGHAADVDVAVLQAWMALAKTLLRNSVPRWAIGTFCDDAVAGHFEGQDEFDKAYAYVAEFHHSVFPDYLERAGYRDLSSSDPKSRYGPRGCNPYYAAPEMDLLEMAEGDWRCTDRAMKEFKEKQADDRLRNYLATGQTYMNTRSMHMSETPYSVFYRAPNASSTPEDSDGFAELMAAQAAMREERKGSSEATRSAKTENDTSWETDGSSASAKTPDNPPPPRPLSVTGLKRKRDPEDEDGSTAMEKESKRTKVEGRAGETGREKVAVQSTRTRVFVKTRRSLVARAKQRTRKRYKKP